MSKEELNEFKVSAIFQNRLITALKGEKESHIELANEIGISKDILIRALNRNQQRYSDPRIEYRNVSQYKITL